MNILPSINKNTAFFYWLQVVSGWDSTAAVDSVTYDYYLSFIPNSDKTAATTLGHIKTILQRHSNPRALLSAVYTDTFSSNSAQQLKDYSSTLHPYFDTLWQQQLPSLEAWHNLLIHYNFTALNSALTRLAVFMESSLDLKRMQTIYLLPNAPAKNTIGHSISSGGVILLRPPQHYDADKSSSVIGVIVHELLHSIEFRSKITRLQMERAYTTYIKPHNIPAPAGYSWKMMFIEATVYCFANSITGGLLRPEIFHKDTPTMDEFEEKFHQFFAKNGYKTTYVFAWVGLCMLPHVASALRAERRIDQEVFAVAAKEFYKLYTN